MSKYITVYEKLCPLDCVDKDDPRRQSIMAEMKAIEKAKTEVAAAEVVQWWGWPTPEYPDATAFVRAARQMLLSSQPSSY